MTGPDSKSAQVEYVPLARVKKQQPPAAEMALVTAAEQTMTSAPKRRRKSLSVFLKLAVLALVGAVGIESYLLIVTSFQTHWLLGSLWSLGLGIIALLLLRFGWRELRQLHRLKRQWQRQQDWQHHPEHFDADVALTQLQRPDLTLLWQQQAQAHWTDAERLQRFETDILSHPDQHAQRVISKWSVDAAVLVAVSPSALLDMLLMLWRNQRMITAIADIYGVQLGYWSRIKLWKQLLANIAYAGASEVLSDVGTSVLGAELAGKLSARAGQGLGAGLLTARLGLQAQALCRPLGFQYQQRPGLGSIQKTILKQLANKISVRSPQSTVVGGNSKTKMEK